MSQTRLPAEWEPQCAVMLTWPHLNTDWRDNFDEAERTYYDIASAILRHQNLLVSCEEAERLQQVQTRLQEIAEQYGTRLFAYQAPADDTWARDHGPITVQEDGKALLLDFTFNAWGDKFGASKDNLLNQTLHTLGAFYDTPIRQVDFILEGGAIESNGEGVLMTTRHCLLQDSRNTGMSQEDIEQALKQFFGVRQVLWLNSGYLEGDDTDAHIDTLARFTAPDTICYVHCDDRTDPHFEALNSMREELEQFRTDEGKPFKLIPLPMASEIRHDDERLPATYANFLIINNAVLLPVYQVPEDQQAIKSLQSCFRDREIIPIDCRSLIRQHGSLHCVTMQLPTGIELAKGISE